MLVLLLSSRVNAATSIAAWMTERVGSASFIREAARQALESALYGRDHHVLDGELRRREC